MSLKVGCCGRNFALNKYEETGHYRKLHDELYEVFTSPDVICLIFSRRMRRTGYVARIGKRRGAYSFFEGNLRERDNLITYAYMGK